MNAGSSLVRDARSRRAMLVAAIGAVAASVTGAIGRPIPARATNGGALKLGVAPAGTADGVGDNEATQTTAIFTTSGHGLYARTVGSGGRGLYGSSGAPSGTTFGVYGTASSSSGRGVSGYVSATSGTTYGLYGQASSASGRGGFGWASATAGTTYGLYGQADSPSGTGVRGVALSVSGQTFGVTGKVASPSGVGVRGSADAPTGPGVGVQGEARGTSGTAVQGIADADMGATRGVHGETRSPDGYGVHGVSTPTASGSGAAILGQSVGGRPGVIGWSQGGGTGVIGYTGATGLPGSTAHVGVHGESRGETDAVGVLARTDVGRAVDAQASSGQAVRATSGTGTAGHFIASTTAGTALRAAGRVRFDQCAGVTKIPEGLASATVSPGVNLVPTTAVVATVLSAVGGVARVERVAVDTVADAFTIHLSANAPAGGLQVAWIAIG